MVPHRSTASTRPRLTSLFGWEAVSRGDMAALVRGAGIELLVNANKGPDPRPHAVQPMPTRHLTEDRACARSSPHNVRAAGQDVPSVIVWIMTRGRPSVLPVQTALCAAFESLKSASTESLAAPSARYEPSKLPPSPHSTTSTYNALAPLWQLNPPGWGNIIESQ